jgi:hypothetical protein
MANQIVYGTPAPPAALRVLRQPLYDTEHLPSAGGVASLIFFQRPLGQAMANVPAAAKTYADTNMQQASLIGSPAEFDLFGFNVRLSNAVSVASFQQIIDMGLFIFTFGQGRPWLRAQLQDIPSGCNIFGGIAYDGAGVATTVGWPISAIPADPKGLYPFAVGGSPIRIRSNETFGVELQWPNGAPAPVTRVRITVTLRGLYYAGL